jgi:predicted Zn-dependent protease
MRLLVVFLVLLLIGCAQTASNGPILNLLPEDKEIQIGRAYVPYSIEEFDGLSPDRQVQEYVRSMGLRLTKVAERKLPYEFYVVNSSQVNAFALPGGPVFITRGLLEKLSSESELAGVLAHELGHINARHHARFLEKQFGLSLLLNIGALLVGNKPYGQTLLQFGQVGAGLLSLKFSRDQEREADDYAVQYTYKIGYDPQGIIRVFELFESMESGGRPPEWLSTHPLPETRIKEVSQDIAKLRPSGSFISDTEDFHRIKSRLQKVRPSFEEFDRGKKALAQREAGKAMEHFRKALEYYPENYTARSYLAYLLARAGRLEEAKKEARTAHEQMPQVFLTNYVMGYVEFLSGSYRRSLEYLERAGGLIPDHASTHYYLGRDYEALGNAGKAIEHYRTALELSQGRAEWASDAQQRLRRLGGM